MKEMDREIVNKDIVSEMIREKEMELMQIIQDVMFDFFNREDNIDMDGDDKGQIAVDATANMMTNTLVYTVEGENNQIEVLNGIYTLSKQHIEMINLNKAQPHELN